MLDRTSHHRTVHVVRVFDCAEEIGTGRPTFHNHVGAATHRVGPIPFGVRFDQALWVQLPSALGHPRQQVRVGSKQMKDGRSVIDDLDRLHRGDEGGAGPFPISLDRVLEVLGEDLGSVRVDQARKKGNRGGEAVVRNLDALGQVEYWLAIRIEAGHSRGITLTSLSAFNLPASNALRTPLPLVGRVAAGSPILAQENIEHEYRVDPSLFSSRPHYLLRVEGSSMRDAGILDGDLLAVHRTPEAQNGQIVVARLDDEVTVKRFKRNGFLVDLLPENPEFEPIRVDLRHQELVIEGLGVGVIRPRLEV